MCEDRQSHEHPFIKITKPENAPTVIITAIQEQPEPEKHESHDEELKGDDNDHHHRRFGRGGRGGCNRGGRGRAFRQFANQMVSMVTRQFMGNADPQTEGGATANPDDEFNTGAFGEKRSKWKEQRAIIVNKPQAPVAASIGQVVFVPIEVLN